MAQAERMPRYANTCTLPSLTISVKTEEMGWMGSFLIESQSSLRINQVYSWETKKLIPVTLTPSSSQTPGCIYPSPQYWGASQLPYSWRRWDMDWRNLQLFVWDSRGSIYLPGSGRVLHQTAFYLHPGEGAMKGGDRGKASRNILSALWINQSVWSLTQKSHVPQETLLNALWWPIWEKNLKKGDYMYV